MSPLPSIHQSPVEVVDEYDEFQEEFSDPGPAELVVRKPKKKKQSNNWTSRILESLKTHPRPWGTLGVLLICLLIYSSQYQKLGQPEVRPNVPEDIPAPVLDADAVIQPELDALNQQGSQLVAIIFEDTQRNIVAYAMGFRALATLYIQTPGHKCNGMTEYDCLRTFDENRILALEDNIPKPPKSMSPNEVFQPLWTNTIEQTQVAGLMLAQILATPETSRQGWQQEFVDNIVPVLHEGYPITDLKPRPITMARLLRDRIDLEANLKQLSEEAINEAEQCLALSEEQQAARGGCY